MTRRLGLACVGAATLVALLATGAFAQQSDVISTSGERGGNVVADARAWWAKHTDAFRSQTAGCRGLLDEAESHRVVAMDYKTRAKAKGPMSGAERTRLNTRGNAESGIVTDLVRGFYECSRPAPANATAANGPFPLPPQDPNAPPGTPGNPLQARVSNDPPVQPDARRLAPLDTALDEILADAAANASAATDQFFTGMTQAVEDNIEYLMQDPGVPVQQIAAAVEEYLTNDNADNHVQLRRAAEEAVHDFLENPARFIGYQVGNTAVGEAPGVAMRAGSAAARAARAARAKAIANAEKAAKRLKSMADDANDVNAAVRASAEREPPSIGTPEGAQEQPQRNVVTSGGPGEEVLPVNPRCLEYNCLPSSIAHEVNVANPENVLRDYDIRFKSRDVPTPWDEGTELLKTYFGDKRIEGLTDPDRLRRQAEGIPTPMDVGDIIDEIKNTPNSRGILIYEREVIERNPEGRIVRSHEGHSAIIENVGDQARVWEPQFERPAMGDFARSTRAWLYRTK